MKCTIEMASKIWSCQYSLCLRYSQDIQKGNTCDDHIKSALYQVCTVWYSMRAILLGPVLLCHFNGALHFTLQVLCGNVLCHLAISVPSMPIICRSNTIIPLMSHITRTKFLMAFQWWASLCVKSTVWENISISSPYSISSPSYILDKCCQR